jgi:hypothetical protein
LQDFLFFRSNSAASFGPPLPLWAAIFGLLWCLMTDARCRVRTSDILCVRQALYR